LNSVGQRAYAFFSGLRAPRVPAGIEVMNPYRQERVREYTRQFFDRYYSDNGQRLLILGINPGRFGAGVTGMAFTDPINLADRCGIANDLPRKPELSSVFIYKMIDMLGGPREFYSRFFLSALCPLGFTRAGKNLNYYDDPRLAKAVAPFIAESVRQHIEFSGRTDHVVILGRGQNLSSFRKLNDRYRWFASVHGLDHPRFIMQYRRRQLAGYLDNYSSLLGQLA
jgi:hypothetical protein